MVAQPLIPILQRYTNDEPALAGTPLPPPPLSPDILTKENRNQSRLRHNHNRPPPSRPANPPIASTPKGIPPPLPNLPLHHPPTHKLTPIKKKQIALVGVFALGFFITIIQIIRIFTIKNLKTYTDSQPIVIWSDVEISLGVCFPQSHVIPSSLFPHHTNNTNGIGNNNLHPDVRPILPRLRIHLIQQLQQQPHIHDKQYI